MPFSGVLKVIGFHSKSGCKFKTKHVTCRAMNCNNRDDCFRERSKLLFFFIINQYVLENLSWFLSFHTTRFYSDIEFLWWNMDSYWEEKQIFNLCIVYIVLYGKRSYFKSYNVSSAELCFQDNIMSTLSKIVIIFQFWIYFAHAQFEDYASY